MKQKVLKISKSTKIMFAIALLTLGLFIPSRFTPSKVEAETISQLRERSAALEAEIAANNSKLEELHATGESLQKVVDELSVEIATANAEIQLTEVKLAELRDRLVKAEAELERQKGLLKSTLQAIYERKGASTFELLMATDSFTDFVNQQEYLGQLQSAVKQSTEQVIKLKQQIEDEKKTQEELLTTQKDKRAVVDGKRRQQQELLDSTQGQEARYKQVVASQQAQLEEAESALAALLAQGSQVNYGPISRGQVLGKTGSTGFSTGPHIHFQVYRNGSTLNPSAGGSSLINGFGWPILNGAGYISQSYGCVADYWYYATKCADGQHSLHNGLDIAVSAGTPVVAADDGSIIFRGCQGGLGYVVVIDHGGGWQTWYPHMMTPDGQVYGYC